MRRLTKSEVLQFRLQQWLKQDKICILCKREIAREDTVLDHDHKTGECRGVLHRGCNALEGKLANGRALNGLQDDNDFLTYLSNLYDYIKNSKLNILHPSHKSEEEKRQIRNKRVRTKRRRVNKAKGESIAGRTKTKEQENE